MDFVLSTINADQDWGYTWRRFGPPERCACRGSAVAGERSCLPLISGLRSIQRQPDGKPLSHQRDAGRGGAARGQGHHGIFPMAQANAAIEKVKKNKVRYGRCWRIKAWFAVLRLIGFEKAVLPEGLPGERPFA